MTETTCSETETSRKSSKRFHFSVGRFFIAYILLAVVLRVAQYYDMKIRMGLEREYFHAMKENDSERAIRYAKKLVKRKEKNWIHGMKGICPRATLLYGYALEASGDLDEAEKTFKEEYISGRSLQLSEARIAYKKGDFQRAFICYYNAVRQRDFNVETNFSDAYIESFERFRDYELFGIPLTISPFADFEEFLSFMEEECAKLDNPQEYAPTITLLYRLQQESEKRAQEKIRQSKSTVEFARPARQVAYVQLNSRQISRLEQTSSRRRIALSVV